MTAPSASRPSSPREARRRPHHRASRNPARQAVAKEFGATDIVEERGDEAVEAVLRLTDGAGVDAALECVGTDQSIETCAGITRAGGMIGAVGVPLYEEFEYKTLFWKNIGIKGGVAPAHQYIPELLETSSPDASTRASSSTQHRPRPRRRGLRRDGRATGHQVADDCQRALGVGHPRRHQRVADRRAGTPDSSSCGRVGMIVT